jgi:AraC-like DNA-binding protein
VQEQVGYDNLYIRLFQAETVTIGEEWCARNVQSSYWRFYRNGKDGAALELAEGPYPLRGQRLYVVPRGVRFSCRNTQQVGHFYAHFDVIGLPGTAMRELFGRPLCLPPAPALEEEVRTVAQALSAGRGAGVAMHCRIKALLYDGLARYLESVPVEQLHRCWGTAATMAPVLPAIRYIERNLFRRMTNSRLAELCCMSEDHFIRRFWESVGQTPAQHIIERRVTIAAQQLLFTDLTIEQIAEETGFGNRFYFARMFARHTGMAPAAYRKMARV